MGAIIVLVISEFYIFWRKYKYYEYLKILSNTLP